MATDPSHAKPVNPGFLRAFIPGLVVGLIVGLFADVVIGTIGGANEPLPRGTGSAPETISQRETRLAPPPAGTGEQPASPASGEAPPSPATDPAGAPDQPVQNPAPPPGE